MLLSHYDFTRYFALLGQDQLRSKEPVYVCPIFEVKGRDVKDITEFYREISTTPLDNKDQGILAFCVDVNVDWAGRPTDNSQLVKAVLDDKGVLNIMGENFGHEFREITGGEAKRIYGNTAGHRSTFAMAECLMGDRYKHGPVRVTTDSRDLLRQL